MNPEDRPRAASDDSGSGESLSPLGNVLTDEADSPLLLLVAPDTGDGPIRTAIAVAGARAGAGLATVLADASFEAPRLHEELGVRNLEGLADVFLFGASLSRVKVQPEAHPFEFVPPGAYMPEPGAVLESSGWDHVEWELRTAGARMILFVPAATPGLGMLSARAGQAVLIGTADDAARMKGRLDPSCRVVAVLDPATVVGVRRPAEVGAPVEVDSLSEPLVFREEPRRTARTVAPVAWALLAVVVALGGWLVYQELFASAPPADPDPGPRTQQVEPEPPARGEPVDSSVPFSVAMAAYRDLSTAWERAVALGQEVPDVQFYVAPVMSNGTEFYRILAGPVSDREAAGALMQRLVATGHKTAYDDWAIRPTSLAFLLGEHDARDEAAARMGELEAAGIPAYVVEVRYERGEPRYRVYGGAYQSATEAAVMEEMLDSAGIEAPLVPRTGQPIPGGR